MTAQAYVCSHYDTTRLRPLPKLFATMQTLQNCINAVSHDALGRWQPRVSVHCGQRRRTERNHYWLKTQRRWKCYSCRKQFSVKVGTIFRGLPARSGHLANRSVDVGELPERRLIRYEIARATGIAQKSAWFVLQRLRFVMKDTRPVTLGVGPVETDECVHRRQARRTCTASAVYSVRSVRTVTHRSGPPSVQDAQERGTQRGTHFCRFPTSSGKPCKRSHSGQRGVWSYGLHGRVAGISDSRRKQKFVHDTVNHIERIRAGISVHTRLSKATGHASSGRWAAPTLQ